MDPIHSAFFFSGRRRHTIWTGDWSSDVCSSDLTLWPVISWTTEKSPPFLDISSLKVYSVGETCLTVTRTLYLSSPILESAVQFQVSPSTVPFASITSPELSNA